MKFSLWTLSNLIRDTLELNLMFLIIFNKSDYWSYRIKTFFLGIS